MNVVALQVKYGNKTCGHLAQVTYEDGLRIFMFQYDAEYLQQSDSRAISLSLPKDESPYYSKELFGFFDNMLAEGWLKKEQSKMLRIDKNDHFQLLLNNGEDLPGAVTVSYDEELSYLLTKNLKV